MSSDLRSGCRPSFLLLPLTAMALGALAAHARAGGGGDPPIVPTTEEDYFQPGTQPDPVGIEPFMHSANCSACHGYYNGDDDYEPYDSWVATMMAQSARDPVWQAAMTIANEQDAANSGETCIRCHAPSGWLGGRSSGGELEDLLPGDFDGVSCHFCHRMVDPIYDKKTSPPQDPPILDDLEFPFTDPGNGRFVVDPIDSRRGPYDDVPINFHSPAEIIHSPFHRTSELCASCHDVSVPTVTKQPDGSYAPNPNGEEHPTGNPYDMFPEQRTYSEWKFSQFAAGGVNFPDGRFGGNHPTGIMESCQDCHMPDQFTGGCFAWNEKPFFPRPDMPRHTFAGANTWVLGAVLDLHGEFETGLSEASVQAAQDRTVQMLRDASDLELMQLDDALNVRITNWSGHKLPTGYPEGRRMWINVRFFDEFDNQIAEHGAYDAQTAELHAEDTKVYEARHGLDATMAAVTGLPEGPSSHLALNNKVFFDNRIPPVGFTNADYELAGAEPVGQVYSDGQHWDDTGYSIPPCATQAVVTVWFQTTTREYAEFLRDAFDDPESLGQVAYDAWVARGMSAPVDMDSALIKLEPPVAGDVDGNGVTDVDDLILVILSWGACKPGEPCPGDTDCDHFVDVNDLINVILFWNR